MADRFKNGRTDNDLGGLPAAKDQSGFDPKDKAYYHGGDLAGRDREDRLHPRPRHHRDLADAELQEQGRAGQQRLPVGRLPRLLDHRLHADRSAPRDQRRAARARHRGARARDEGLLRHHHQPHRGRDLLRGGRGAGLRLQGPRALQGRLRPRVRRPRLRGHEQLPAAVGERLLPVPPVQPGRRGDRQGPVLAQRRAPLPQPRQHDLHGRELPLRRLLRARRPLHRAAAGRGRDDGDLREVDRRLLDRRLPHRHDEARQRRVLAAVPARRARLRAPPGQARVLHVRRGVRHHAPVHVALHDDRPLAGRARLPVPGGRPELRRQLGLDRRAARLLRGRRLVHRRGLQRLPAADVPGQPRHGPDRPLHPAGQRRRGRRRAARPRPARAPADVPLARQPGHLLRRRAGLHRRQAATRTRARTCSRARSAPTTTTT